MHSQRRIRGIVLCAAAVAAAASAARADSFTLNFGTTFSGTSPSGPGPYVTLTCSSTTAGTVNFTLQSHLMGSTEFITDVFLNLNPSLNPSLLMFSQTSLTEPQATATTGADFREVAGSGRYDVNLAFPTGNSQNRFDGSESVNLTVTSTQPITCASFQFLSQPPAGNGTFTGAVHVQGIGTGEGSGFIGNTLQGVPLPPGVALAGAGLMTLGARRRRLL